MQAMNHKAAIIDMCTNTFHLIIVEWTGRQYQVLRKLQLPVKLGKGGFEHGFIQEDAFERGIAAIQEFKALIKTYEIDKVKAYGTSALRNATNAHDFQMEVENLLHRPVQIIDGIKEAELIYEGVRKAVPLGEEPNLIMDIGGGSVEFIIADANHIYWKQSYEIGAARLLERFHHTDPISRESIKSMSDFIDEVLDEVWNRCEKYEIKTLVGASGTFESIAEMDMNIYYSHSRSMPFVHHIVALQHFSEIANRIIGSTREELYQMPGLALFRAEMITVGILLIKIVVAKLKIKKIIASDYALKEGILFQMMEQYP